MDLGRNFQYGLGSCIRPPEKGRQFAPQSITDTTIVASHCCNEDYIAWGFLTKLSKWLQKLRAIANAACSVYISLSGAVENGSVYPSWKCWVQKLVPLVGLGLGNGGTEEGGEEECVCVWGGVWGGVRVRV